MSDTISTPWPGSPARPLSGTGAFVVALVLGLAILGFGNVLGRQT